ncbi:EF-P 5-aminopentanol modification-associated protein YfmF [Marasmitruncus massiliensis]|uniref:EF-P 5-aminopentanol modification-associated protein YfmF n=1 Tax=Marasmitruncus massiliensis TaxID=1944642 RepID=UPI000C7A41DE|nr:pitrilysin family protein [Marasmitruncus massiliensis]
MSDQFQRIQLCGGVHFSSVTDPKFKHNRITANMVLPLNRDTVTNQAVVPFVLRKGSRVCPDFTQLNRRLCELYGANLSCDVSKFGGYQVLELSIYGIDDRFAMDGQSMIASCAQLLTEVLLDPNMNGGLFSEQDVELEKQQIIDTIESLINDKRAYAMSRCKSIMCEGETLAIEKYGYIEDAKRITAQSASEAYQNIMKTAQVELIFVGCGNPEIAADIFAKAFGGLRRSPVAVERTVTKLSADHVKETTDEMDVAQSKLVMGFRTGNITSRREFGATRMMVALFGGTPNSRLFTYVREKLSLCYYCAARFDRLTGLMFVDSGVEKRNKQKAYDEILKQLDVLREGGFSDQEIVASRLIMQNSLKSVGDSLGAIEEWYLTQIMGGECYSPSDETELLEEITREDIIAAARRVTLDTVYFLTGKEAE